VALYLRWDLGAPAESGRQSLAAALRGKVCGWMRAAYRVRLRRGREGQRRAAPRRDAKTAILIELLRRYRVRMLAS